MFNIADERKNKGMCFRMLYSRACISAGAFGYEVMRLQREQC